MYDLPVKVFCQPSKTGSTQNKTDNLKTFATTIVNFVPGRYQHFSQCYFTRFDRNPTCKAVPLVAHPVLFGLVFVNPAHTAFYIWTANIPHG